MAMVSIPTLAAILISVLTLCAALILALFQIGGRVFAETLNAFSHCLAGMVALCGLGVLLLTVRNKPVHQKWSVLCYALSLINMYASSTVYHTTCLVAPGSHAEFFTQKLDYSSVFALIAGTYTPILTIKFHSKIWATLLLTFVWAVAIFGTIFAVMFDGPHKIQILYILFVALGWVVMLVFPRVVRALGSYSTRLLVLGGVLYTLGVPFNLRNRQDFGFPDHTIWHIFVIFASSFHFQLIHHLAGMPVAGTKPLLA